MLMSTAYPIVVCAGIVPDPLQTLEPGRFQLRLAAWEMAENEMLRPAVLS